MPPKVPVRDTAAAKMESETCFDLSMQARTTPSGDSVRNPTGKTSRRAPYSLHGFDWVNNGLEFFAIFDSTRMNIGEYEQLTQHLPENTYVSRKRFIIAGSDNGIPGDISPLLQMQMGVQEIEVQWSPCWFKIQDLDKEPVAALLDNELLRSRLAKIPRAHSRLYWRNDVGVVFLDDEAPSHLCLGENYEVCKDLWKNDCWHCKERGFGWEEKQAAIQDRWPSEGASS